MTFMLFLRGRFDSNAPNYLNSINDRILEAKNGQNPFTFNSDFKVMKNVLYSRRSFGEFYGIYNNYDVLLNEVQIYLQEANLINLFLEKSTNVKVDSLDKIEEAIEVI